MKPCEVISFRLKAQAELFCFVLIMTVLLAQSTQMSFILNDLVILKITELWSVWLSWLGVVLQTEGS